MRSHDHQAALLVPCGGCGAQPGEKCQNWGVESSVPHEDRLIPIREVHPVRVVNFLDLLLEQVAS